MRTRLVVVAAAIILGCGTGAGPDPAAVRATIDRKNRQIARWYAEGQIDSVVAHFAADAWQMPPNAPPLVGREAMRAFWSQATQWGTWRFELNVQDVVVADSIAVERGKYTLRFEAGSQSPIPASQDRGNYLVLWRLESDGEWRVVWDAPVSELPPGPGA